MSDQQHQALVAIEAARIDAFSEIWNDKVNDSFAGIAKYYDRANYVATLGLYGWLSNNFLNQIAISPNDRLLDVCAGTMAVSIALMKREPTLQAKAIDRSEAMLNMGHQRSTQLGFTIDHTVQEVPPLPYPDNSFDVVTLQYASRHLKVIDVFKEVHRVLAPGGHFYHCDMLRPENKIIEQGYHAYLKFCLGFTAMMFKSADEAHELKRYFVDALSLFYTASDLSLLLDDLGFTDIRCKTLLGKTIGMHSAMK